MKTATKTLTVKGIEFIQVADRNYNSYLISRCGKIFSTKSNKILKNLSRNFYQYVRLYNNSGKYKNYSVHVLVMKTFVGKRPNGKVVDHIDGDRTNNNLDNLQYVTQKQNIQKYFDSIA